MKKLMGILILTMSMVSLGASFPDACHTQRVNGYIKSDGTVVNSYYRRPATTHTYAY